MALGSFGVASDFVVDQRVRPQNEGDVNNTATLVGDETSQTQTNDSLNADLEATEGYQSVDGGGLQNAQRINQRSRAMELVAKGVQTAFLPSCSGFFGSPYRCAIGVVAGIVAGNLNRTANDSMTTSRAFGGTTNYDTGSNSNEAVNQELIQGIETLEGLGYTVGTSGTITTPEGTKLTGGDLRTVEGLKAFGATESEAAKMVQELAEVQKQAQQQAAAGFGSSEDIGSESSGPESSATQASAGVATKSQEDGAFESSDGSGSGQAVSKAEYRRRSKKKKMARMPASEAAEFSKDFHGTPIGIDIANIFLIVHKKYRDKKSKKTEFINKEY